MPKISPPGWVRLKESYPYLEKGIDNLLIKLQIILKENPYTQKITVEVGKPCIDIEKLVREKDITPEQKGLPLQALIRHRPMFEFIPKSGVNSLRQLQIMFDLITREGLNVNCILAGDIYKFTRWVKMPLTSTVVFGIPILQIPETPEEVILVCGAALKDADPDDLEYSVMGRIA